MLTIEIPTTELFDENTNEFIVVKARTLSFEHSLISLSKWESKWCVPFLHTDYTNEQLRDYIRCMCFSRDITLEDVLLFPSSVIKEITNYLDAPMTATTVQDGGGINHQIITSELIYSWMVAYRIPVEFEKWHLARLMTLIRVVNAQNQKPKKLSQQEIYERNAKLNAERKAKYGGAG